MDVVRVPVIVGPTGAGKTRIALSLAQRFPLTVISADSRQIYRGFDIGTAKPTVEERRCVPHEGIDVADPGERWSAPRWASAAEQWIDTSRRAGRLPVVVGGTGFYVRALFEPVFEEPPLDPVARAALARELGALSNDELRQRVRKVDPARAHLGRAQLLRALEVFELSGSPISEWHRRSARPARFAPCYLYLDANPNALRARLDVRLAAMLRDGWLDEVRTLAARVDPGAPAWQATGYHALRQALSSNGDLATVSHKILTTTYQYAKRQRTWFRHQLPATGVTRLDAFAMDPDLFQQVLPWWTTEAAS